MANHYPYFRWFVNDYRDDTGDLMPMEDLAYRRLIDEYMRRRAPLPVQPERLAQLIRFSKEQWETVASALIPRYLKTRGASYHIQRCDDEIRWQETQSAARKRGGDISAKRALRGRKGFATKAAETANLNSSASTEPIADPIAELTGIQIQTQSQKEEKESFFSPTSSENPTTTTQPSSSSAQAREDHDVKKSRKRGASKPQPEQTAPLPLDENPLDAWPEFCPTRAEMAAIDKHVPCYSDDPIEEMKNVQAAMLLKGYKPPRNRRERDALFRIMLQWLQARAQRRSMN